ncbi:MAG: hypothetical protein [Caudoviricetes sp.]|nr:MAG: hypothetical protein [Caudoviricetes sp.]
MKMQPEIHPMEEYIDALVTCEIAMLMARKHKEPVDKAVSLCALAQSAKCKDQRNANLFLRVAMCDFPAAMVYHFRTMLDEEISRI